MKAVIFRVSIVVLLALAGCKDTNTQSSLPGAKHHLDGKLDDWAQIKPLLEEAGKVGTEFENKIDVKQVYIDSDEHSLYLFLKCLPSIKEQYDAGHMNSRIAELYLDVDSDPRTGCKQAEIHFHPEKHDGYDVAIRFVISTGAEVTPGMAPIEFYNVGLSITPWDAQAAEFPSDPLPERDSRNTPQWIADGPDGVEIRIPLKELHLAPGDSFEFLLKESANSWDTRGFNKGTVTLKQ